MIRFALRFSMTLSLLLPVAVAQAGEGERVETLAGLELTIPDEAEATAKRLEEGVEVIAVTHGDEVLLITIYSGKKAPRAKAALSTHRDEIERKVPDEAAKDLKSRTQRQRMLGRWRPGFEITWHQGEDKHVARVTSARKRGLTIVAAWTRPWKGLTKAFSPAVVKSISVPK